MLSAFLLYRLRQLQGIDRVNQPHLIDNIFHFIRLQVTDHMPLNILWQCLVFLPDLLHFIFPKHTDAQIIGFLKRLHRLCLADGNQSDFFSLPTRPVARCLYPCLDFFQIFPKQFYSPFPFR